MGGVALTEGSKFLYGQATELLKGRRESADASAGSTATTTMELVRQQPPVLDGPLASAQVDLDLVAAHEAELRELRRVLADYAEGLADVDPNDGQVLQQVEALRALLELAYGQHLTFQGEARPSTGAPLQVVTGPQDDRRQVQISADKIQGQQIGDNNTQTNTYGQ